MRHLLTYSLALFLALLVGPLLSGDKMQPKSYQLTATPFGGGSGKIVFVSSVTLDGNLLGGDKAANLGVMDSDGTNMKLITWDLPFGLGDYSPSWSPDGKYIVFKAHSIIGNDQSYVI